MGNAIQQTDLLIHDWQYWQLFTSTSHLILNLKTHQIASYKLFSSINNQLFHTYQFRRKNQQFLVNVIGIMNYRMTSFCFNHNSSLRRINNRQGNLLVLIENIEYRIGDLGALSFIDALYIMKQCLEGIKALQTQYGQQKINQIYLQEQMIGINSEGECKIWFNQNYFDDIDRNMEMENPEQSPNIKIIQHLFSLIQARMMTRIEQDEKKQYERAKKQYLQKSGIYTYNLLQSLEFINKVSQLNNINIQKHKISVPTTLKSSIEQKIIGFENKNKKLHIIFGSNQKQNKSKFSLKAMKMNNFDRKINPQDIGSESRQLRTTFTSAGKRPSYIIEDKVDRIKDNRIRGEKTLGSRLKVFPLIKQNEYESQIIKNQINIRQAMGISIRRKVY